MTKALTSIDDLMRPVLASRPGPLIFVSTFPSSHSFWGDDPSGYCGCDGCNALEE